MATESSEVFSPPAVEAVTPPYTSNIHRILSSSFPLTWEKALVVGLALAGVITRLWNLGARVMSHDESLHVYYSWLLATGKGFNHNPMMHGPLLFETTALMDFLFGAGDFTSRLVPVMAGLSLSLQYLSFSSPGLAGLELCSHRCYS